MNDQPRKMEARVTHLEMTRFTSATFPVPTKPRIALIRAENIQPAFYNFLYEQIGREHHWVMRRDMSAEELDLAINNDDTEIHVLYADGCPAGFFELDLGRLSEQVEIVYFGISPPYQGLGLSKWFLSACISAAWSHAPEKLVVETNTLDHPAALSLYQKLGFSPVAISTIEVPVWD